MKTLITVLAAVWLVLPVRAATHDVSYGSFEAPDDFTFKRTGTIDSFSGTLTRNSDGFTISFDIGGMSGTHMSPKERNKCVFFRTHTINGNFTWTGIEHAEGKQTVTTTVYDYGERARLLSEESSAMRNLPPEQRDAKARELNERWAQLNKDRKRHPPANFWADVTRETDLAEFLLIVNSYKLKTQ